MQYKLSDNTWDENELSAIDRVVKSGFYTMGKEVEVYEKEFAKKMGSKYAVMSNSGSSANLLMIAALCYSKKLILGDEVIVPAVSWSTTYFPIAQYGLRLKFVDINYNTLNMDLEELKKAISDKTKAIMCVNLLGNSNEYNEIRKICEEKEIYLLEDNCESLGGEYLGQKLGTIGLLGTFSTFYSHHLCTMEGGVTVTDSEELYHYMLSIRAHGWTRNLPKTSKIYKKRDDEFYESFNFIMPGYNLRPLEIEAAIGQEQLKKMDDIIKMRRENARYFAKKMEDVREFYNIQEECGKSSWFGFAVILKNKLSGTRGRLIKLLRDNNVEVRPIVTGNFTRNTAISYLDYEVSGKLINADIIHENGFFVGNHCKNNSNQIDLFIKLIKEHAKNEE